jgi:hypothetical protein
MTVDNVTETKVRKGTMMCRPKDTTRCTGRPPKQSAKCEKWLVSRLSGPPVEEVMIKTESEALGFSYGTLLRAKAKIGATSKKFGNVSFWCRPDQLENKPQPVSNVVSVAPSPAQQEDQPVWNGMIVADEMYLRSLCGERLRAGESPEDVRRLAVKTAKDNPAAKNQYLNERAVSQIVAECVEDFDKDKFENLVANNDMLVQQPDRFFQLATLTNLVDAVEYLACERVPSAAEFGEKFVNESNDLLSRVLDRLMLNNPISLLRERISVCQQRGATPEYVQHLESVLQSVRNRKKQS